jgi:hypothetical protein
MLSTLDWALIETWKDAGVPLAAVLRGIDSAFDKYDARPSKTRKVNSLAFCAQEVLAAAEQMNQAAAGTSREANPKGFDREEIAAFLRRNASALESVQLPSRCGVSPGAVAREVSRSLNQLAQEIEAQSLPARLEELERKLTVFEDKLLALLVAAVPDDEVASIRGQADRELAPYRRKMSSSQIELLQKQYVYKRLMEKYGLPRLSLFYL